jgi:hypothetical protein
VSLRVAAPCQCVPVNSDVRAASCSSLSAFSTNRGRSSFGSHVMYSITADDLPIELTDAPQSSVGAPCPMVLAGEHSLHLAYYLQNAPAGWDGTSVTLVSDADADEPCALVSFKLALAHMFGPPNDEAFHGHPLAERGLRPYAVFEIRNSSWLRKLERMNSVHPRHKPEHFEQFKHFIFAFHDTTFECIAESYSVAIHHGSVRSVLISEAQNEA